MVAAAVIWADRTPRCCWVDAKRRLLGVFSTRWTLMRAPETLCHSPRGAVK